RTGLAEAVERGAPARPVRGRRRRLPGPARTAHRRRAHAAPPGERTGGRALAAAARGGRGRAASCAVLAPAARAVAARLLRGERAVLVLARAVAVRRTARAGRDGGAVRAPEALPHRLLVGWIREPDHAGAHRALAQRAPMDRWTAGAAARRARGSGRPDLGPAGGLRSHGARPRELISRPPIASAAAALGRCRRSTARAGCSS